MYCYYFGLVVKVAPLIKRLIISMVMTGKATIFGVTTELAITEQATTKKAITAVTKINLEI